MRSDHRAFLFVTILLAAFVLLIGWVISTRPADAVSSHHVTSDGAYYDTDTGRFRVDPFNSGAHSYIVFTPLVDLPTRCHYYTVGDATEEGYPETETMALLRARYQRSDMPDRYGFDLDAAYEFLLAGGTWERLDWLADQPPADE